MIDINELTLGQVKELTKIVGSECNKRNPKNNDHPYEIGEQYFIRTVTMYFTGRLIEVYEKELVLEDCAWIADTGRYSDAIKKGTFSEVEPLPNKNIIGRGAIIDCTPWSLTLPRDQK